MAAITAHLQDSTRSLFYIVLHAHMVLEGGTERVWRAGMVVEDATRLRQLPLNALPPKRPPGGGLPPGAIWTEHVRQLRLGDFMLRLDVASIHTALIAQPPALRLAQTARAGKRMRVQFVSTEKVRLFAARPPVATLAGVSRFNWRTGDNTCTRRRAGVHVCV